jgi:hypothetical protein
MAPAKAATMREKDEKGRARESRESRKESTLLVEGVRELKSLGDMRNALRSIGQDRKKWLQGIDL